MASGSYGNGAGGGCALKISWSSSAGTGGSTVSASLIAQNQNGYYWYARVYAYGITINGSQVTGSNAALSSTANGASTLISHSVWVGYTGNKSITISGYANFGSAGISGLGNQSISGTATLDKVGSAPSMGSITAPSTGTWSETTTGITVSWNAGSSYNNSGKYRVDVSINGGAYNWVSGDLSWGTTSWTYGITPSQGTTYQFRVCCGNDVGWSSHQYSGVVTLNTINPPTIGSLGTFNPYVNSTYTVPLSGGSQTNGGAFKRCANIHVNGTYKYAGNFPSSNGNTSVTITVTPANIASDLGKNAYSSSTMFSIIAWCENANGTRSSYVGKNFTVNLNSDGKAVPSLSDFTISGGAFSNTATCFIAGVTNVNVSDISASANRYPSGTSISYTVSCTGVGNQYGQNVTFSGLGAGVKTITVTARDSRGLSTSVSKQIRVQSYSAPVIRNYSITRDSTTQTSAKIAYTLSYSPIYSYANGYNTATSGNLNGISYQSYSKDGSTWTACKTGDTITGLSTESVYNIQLCIADNVLTSGWVYASYKVPTIKTNVAIRKNGIGINCVPQNSYALEVDGAGHVTGLMNVDGNLNANSALNVAGDANFKSDIQIPAKASSLDQSVPGAGDYSSVVSNTSTLKDAKSFLGSAVMDGSWYAVMSARHRNGAGDGTSYGMWIRTNLVQDGSLYWGKQYGTNSWTSDRKLLDSSNYTGVVSSVRDSATGNPTTFSYDSTGLNMSQFTWFACWNGRQLRAVSKDNVKSWLGISDSGWNTLWTSGSSYIKYRKINGVVYVQGVSEGNFKVTRNEWATVATLPSGYRPSIDSNTLTTPRSGWKGIQVSITTDGSVKLYNTNTDYDSAYWAFNVSFIA